MRRRHHCPPHPVHCGTKTVVDPVMNNVQHTYSQEVIEHIHPVHTTVVNHHKVNNVHMYPHTTSFANEETCEETHLSPVHDNKPMPNPCKDCGPMPMPMQQPMPMPQQVSPEMYQQPMQQPQMAPKPKPTQKKWY
ncbi:CotD family spore coat protein [Terribacillus sp. DMT04]|uniref:CotD family spore coat protein n=1 Tax=Terribacillus sp. DMT04 TaxID=2850441 RepID=UPI001C2C0753|nr:CotD family spore coat protein [Terribacillus sp. DMT04]QXE00231.1 spore coat protein [Terribacillus sp. DMT04]